MFHQPAPIPHDELARTNPGIARKLNLYLWCKNMGCLPRVGGAGDQSERDYILFTRFGEGEAEASKPTN